MALTATELPELRALERPWAVRARGDEALLDQLCHAIDGPFHLLDPATFAANLESFQDVLADEGVRGRVYYGKKANKAGVWLREVARLGGSVDVASSAELVHALANGIRGEDIGVTGAAKSDELLWLAARHGCLVAIDAVDELHRAVALLGDADAGVVRPLRILLRILSSENGASRFGLSAEDREVALDVCRLHPDRIDLRGFSFHLDGYAVEPRAAMALELVELCLRTRNRGLAADTISIGGGFACSYLTKEDWQSFSAALHPGQFHAGKTFEKFYPYFQEVTGARMLAAILQTPSATGSLARTLATQDIELYVEPGRALLDGAGASVFPVQGFKYGSGHGLITVAGLSMSLSEQWKNSEFLPAPILVQRGPSRPQATVHAAVGGSSCMEYDVLSWRKIPFPARPRYGDLLIYPNTAGYQMDKNESEFHQLPLPPKVVLRDVGDGFVWKVDR